MGKVEGMADPTPVFRPARRDDVPAIVRLLAADSLGSKRERPEMPLPDAYLAAFDAMAAQPGNQMIVAELPGDDGPELAGCLQLTVIASLSRQGMSRAQIESVRVAPACRGRRLGEAMMRDAIARARAAGCGLVQLTTDTSRADARRFYERMGFAASHVGMKLILD